MSELLERREVLLSDVQQATRTQRRRLMEVQAREHVGAAGWAQASALDSIVRLGREGLSATDSLRQVVRLTTEQLRALPLLALPEESGGHLQALSDIVKNGEEQLTAAQALEEMICQALEEVRHTPVDQVNVSRLRQIYEKVQQQVGALDTIIAAARAQASTLEQASELEQISAAHQQKVNEMHQILTEEEVGALGEAGRDLVERIAQFDQAEHQQLQALQKIADSVVEQLPETGADCAAQVQALEQVARNAQQKASELREEADKTR